MTCSARAAAWRSTALATSLALAVGLSAIAADAWAKPKVPLPKPRPIARNAVPKSANTAATAPAAAAAAAPAPLAAATRQHAALPPPARKPVAAAAVAATTSTPQSDKDALENVIELIRKHKPADATQAEAAISDPVARKLAEWLILRSDDNGAAFERYRAFLSANAKGRFSLARVMIARGDRANAERLVREAWRNDPMSEDTETTALDLFGALLTAGDHKARMDTLLYGTEQEAAGLRAAKRLGAGHVALAKARIASNRKASNSKALLEAVPHELHGDAGYLFARIQLLRREEKFTEAAQLMMSAPKDSARLYNVDEWWIERRLLSRKMIDVGEDRTAYLIARDAALPARDIYKTEQEAAGLRAAKRLGAGHVALAKARIASNRKASNSKALLEAVPHELHGDAGYLFARIQLLRREEKFTEAAQLMMSAPKDSARLYNVDEWWIERRLLSRKMIDVGEHRTAYLIARDAALPARDIYKTEQEFTAGWIALRFLNDPATAAQHFARIGVGSVNPTALARAGYWQGRAAEAAGRAQEARAAYTRAADQSTSYYGQLARAKLGLPQIELNGAPTGRSRGIERLEIVRAVQLLYELDEREIAIPIFGDLGENGDPDALVGLGELTSRYSDARGMLLLGKAALNRGLPFDFYAYPVNGIPPFKQFGPEIEQSIVYAIARQESAFNPAVVSPAQASYIMTFAAYNAGRGSVKKWVDRYGDPRDPKVDAVDWVEQIPFSETRNYVQRIMENLQVYRARFGGGTRLQIEADLRRGASVE